MPEYIEREAAIGAAFSATSLGNSAFRDVYDTVNRLRLIPAAEVAPVRHGRFLPGNSRPRTWQFKCSNCGGIAYFPQPKYFSKGCGYRYCPNCGAKMDEEAKE